MQNDHGPASVDHVTWALLAEGHYRDEEAKKIVLNLHYAGTADEDGIDSWFTSLLADLPPETIESLQAHTLSKVLHGIGAHKFAKILARVDLSYAIDVIRNFCSKLLSGSMNWLGYSDLIRFSASIRNEILGCCTQERFKEIAVGLSYLSKTAGRIMDQDLWTLMPQWPIRHSIDFVIKSHAKKGSIRS